MVGASPGQVWCRAPVLVVVGVPGPGGLSKGGGRRVWGLKHKVRHG